MHKSSKSPATSESGGSLSAPSLDWDDLRYVLTVSRLGSFTRTAVALNIQYSTVMRRINAIEKRLQVRLFERLRSGYVMTPAGQQLCQTAQQCETLIQEGERLVMGTDAKLHGRLQVSTASVLAQYLLPGPLAKFCALHPNIEVEVHSSGRRIDLQKRESDIALRLSAEAPDNTFGRKLGNAQFRIYGHRALPVAIKAAGNPMANAVEQLATASHWISFERDANYRTYDHWLRLNVPAQSVVVRTDSFPSVLAFVRAGLGVALLPEFMTKGDNSLVALSGPIAQMQSPVWLLTHTDLRHTARVRAFMRTVGDEMATLLLA